MKMRVAIVHPWPNLGAVPSLYGAAVLLSKHGYLVDIFTSVSSKFATPTFNDDRITLRFSSPIAFIDLAQRHQSLRSRVVALVRSPYRIVQMWRWFLQNVLEVWRLHRRNPYRCVIGVDPEGLWQGNYLAGFIRVPLIYYSLELLLSHELSGNGQKRLKKRELSLSRKASFVIIQDEERARLLAQDNRIPIKNFAMVPNSPLGAGGRRPSYYWHQRFALSSDQRVVLYTGTIAQWTGMEEIVSSVRFWPENWVLVVHSRSNAESSVLVRKLRELAVLGRAFFSLQPVTRQEYDILVDGADIGIAFYVSTRDSTYTGQNVQSLGLSSGKIADYLRAGLPVIVNQAGSISELLQRERCGIAVENGQEIGRAIAEIAQQYREYSERACQVFENYLDFGRGFQDVLRRIDSLEEETQCQ
jgi:glycosyltransferase involved in cell wall biosynthesis